MCMLFLYFSRFFPGDLFLLEGYGGIFERRKVSKENSIKIDSRRVKILMSKFEILQNHRIEYELDEIQKLYEAEKKL